MREFLIQDTIVKDKRFHALSIKSSFNDALGVWVKALILFSHSQKHSLSLVQWNLNSLPQSLIDVGLFAVAGKEVVMVEPTHARFDVEAAVTGLKKLRMCELDLMALWNEFSGNLPKVKAMTPDRKSKAMARIRECDDRNTWIAVIKYLSATPFYNGNNDRKWRADFKYVLRPGVWADLSERLDGSVAETFEAW
jgi:hypothetical protein